MSKIVAIFVFFLFASGSFHAQTFSISGTIVDNNEPIIGATVILTETNQGAITDLDGSFSIENVKPGDYTLKVSYISYLSQIKEVTVTNSDVKLEDIVLQVDFFNMEQVVVTATRNEILRKDAPIVCNVIDNRLFEATQSVVLAEGLSFQPALRVENNCQNCGFNGLRMNGLEGAYSQILIDGRPIYNSLQGVYGLEQIPANMIERVEVVRSGGSALYGSSAVAGTVNIITKEPTKNASYLKTNQALINGTAADRTYMIGTDFVSDDKKTGVTLSGFHRNRDFYDANDDGYSEMGHLKATSFAMKAFYKPTELSKITFNGFNIYEFRRGGNKFDRPLHESDIAESTTHNILNGGLTYEQFTKNKKHKFSTYLNYQHLDRDSYYGAEGDVNAYGNSEDKSFVGGFQYTSKLGKFAGGEHTLVTGFEYNRNNLKDNAPSYNRFIDQTAEQVGVYLQDVWGIGKKFNVLLGGRFDKHNLVGEPVLSPRANVLYKITRDLQFRLGYARGFRSPQVFDEDLHITQVGGEGTVITNANNLTPEYSNAFSTSLDFNKHKGDWLLGITLDGFYTQLTNVFILEEQGVEGNGDLLLERRNGSGATVAGITINPKVQYKNKLSLQFGITLQNSEYDDPVQWSETVANSSNRFFRTPDQYGFYVFSWDLLKSLTLNLSGVYTGSMIAQHYAGHIEEDVLETTPSFFENNFKIDFSPKLKSKLDIAFNAGIQNYTNAFQSDFDLGIDRDAGYVYGPGRPRTFFLGMSIQF